MQDYEVSREDMNEQAQPYREYVVHLQRAGPSAPWQVSVENVSGGHTSKLDTPEALVEFFFRELKTDASGDPQRVGAGLA